MADGSENIHKHEGRAEKNSDVTEINMCYLVSSTTPKQTSSNVCFGVVDRLTISGF
jgi:hypothetical protein